MAQILLIDDDDSMHEIIPVFLEGKGHQTHCAATGPEGLELAFCDRPDLILLDISMPDMDGGDVLRALKAEATTADIPVVIFTVHDRQDLPSELVEGSHIGYIQKPLNMDTLGAAVNIALHEPKILR